MSICIAKGIEGKKITPRAIGRIQKGNFYIPDCPYYKPRINIPNKVKRDEVFTGWNCHNCKNFKTSNK